MALPTPGKDTLPWRLSYRSRLTLFFVLIVIVPMIAVATLVVRLSSESRTGKADARLAANLQTALGVYRQDRDVNGGEAAAAARDGELKSALERGNRPALARAVERVSRERKLVELSVSDPNGKSLATRVTGTPVAVVRLALRGGTTSLGTLSASGTAGAEYLAEVRQLTGAEAILTRHGSDLLATAGIDTAPSDSRRRSAELEPDLAIEVLNPKESAGLLDSQPLLIAVLLAFFGVAMVLILPLLRDLQQFHELVEEQAITDELTGLSNRHGFRRVIDKEVERAKRFGRPLSLLMIDIDDFKAINDTHGHPAGDQVLREVGRLLREESRAIDEPARYGGEEFTVALPETNASGAVELGERIRKRIESTPIALSRGSGTVDARVSIGVAEMPGGEADVEALVGAADKALYEAKREGKNRTSVASDPLQARKKAPEQA